MCLIIMDQGNVTSRSLTYRHKYDYVTTISVHLSLYSAHFQISTMPLHVTLGTVNDWLTDFEHDFTELDTKLKNLCAEVAQGAEEPLLRGRVEEPRLKLMDLYQELLETTEEEHSVRTSIQSAAVAEKRRRLS